MARTRTRAALAACLTLMLAADGLAQGQPGSLSTVFAASGSDRGSLFDITPSVNLRIQNIDLNLSGVAGQAQVDVWFRKESVVGKENETAGWILLGSGQASPAGLNLPTPFALDNAGYTFKAGQTYGLYVDVTSYPTHALAYTAGAPQTFANEDLLLRTHATKGDPVFTGPTTPVRRFNGSLHYLTIPTVNVAIVAADLSAGGDCRFLDVRDYLLATGKFNSVEIIKANLVTPTLADLERYDAVVTWSDINYADSTALGDAMADYVDADGGVVVAALANADANTNRKLEGRWATGGYEVILAGSGLTTGAATLGTVHEPEHPVMQGVVSFDGGSSSIRPSGTALDAGATLLAEWSDGRVLAAQGQAANRIDLGFYPASDNCGVGLWDATTDGDKLLANALVAVAGLRRTGTGGGDVLVAASPGNSLWLDEVQLKLQNTGLLGTVDAFYTRTGTPTLAELQMYSAVLTFTDAGPQDSILLGDTLADYVDSGGGVVVATFANASIRIQGRWQPAYEVIQGIGQTQGGGPFTLGTLHDPGHPVLANVIAFSGGSSSYRPRDMTLTAGSTLIAEWSDARYLVAEGSTPQRIDLGFYPPSSDSRADFWDSSSNGDILMANALIYTGGGSAGGACGKSFTYCTAGTTSNGCRASISAAGIPSGSQGGGFTLTVSSVEGNKNGILFYGIDGPNVTPWGAGSTSFLCVKAPTQRMGLLSSGGTPGQCDGQFLLDWNAWIAAHPGKLGTPFEGGCGVWAQAWFRDPPSPRTTSLSDAIEFVTCP